MIHTLFTQFASETTGAKSASPIDALGIDVKLLVFQIIAFAILVWVLSRFVFPVLMRAVDERQKAIDESLQAAHAAEKNAAAAQAKIDEMLKSARAEAGDIVTTAKDEASAMVARAEEKSRAQAEHIVAEARESIGKEIVAAKKALHNETIELVAQATEKVVGKSVDAKVDKTVIADSLKETK